MGFSPLSLRKIKYLILKYIIINKKKIIIIISIVLAIVLIGGAVFYWQKNYNKTKQIEKELKTFKHPGLGISISYPSDWEAGVPWFNDEELKKRPYLRGFYKISTTQTYPSRDYPMDGYVSINKTNNLENLSLQKLFNKWHEICEEREKERIASGDIGGMGCFGAEDTSGWQKYEINGHEVLRSGKRGMPEGLPVDSIYIKKNNYFILIEAVYYNENYDLGSVFEKIASSVEVN